MVHVLFKISYHVTKAGYDSSPMGCPPSNTSIKESSGQIQPNYKQPYKRHISHNLHKDVVFHLCII